MAWNESMGVFKHIHPNQGIIVSKMHSNEAILFFL